MKSQNFYKISNEYREDVHPKTPKKKIGRSFRTYSKMTKLIPLLANQEWVGKTILLVVIR